MCITIDQTSLINSFKDIYLCANSHERQLIIDILFTESFPADLWYIHYKLKDKQSYYFDILSHLPYGLLQMILTYFNIEDIITFLMENIIWRNLFTSNDMAKILIVNYFDPQIVKNTSMNNWYPLFQKLMKKYIKFKKGIANSFHILHFYNKTTTCSLYSRLQDDYLILYNHSTTESSNKGITLYHLKHDITQKDAKYISTENNEGMLSVSLDDYILVGVNYFGIFYIWSLQSLKLIHSFKIESSDIEFMTCYNNNICFTTFSHILSIWNLELKKTIFYKTLREIDNNLPEKYNIIGMEFLKKSNDLILCVEIVITNSQISYYEYKVYILSVHNGHILRHGSLMNKNRPFKLNIINKSELITFYEFNSNNYWKMDLKTMQIVSCLSYKNLTRELECLIYPQNSLIIKYLKSVNNSLDDGLYIEKSDPETGILISKNKILGSENIIHDQLHYLKNKYLLQGNDDWVIFNQRNKIFVWGF
ncbi:hypothetical protein PCK1_000147 [Pneumocystis canis]|nr:hypothetical protein PCK1_000147 [Pneumocystis canis]